MSRIALLANPDSGSGNGYDVAGAMSADGAEVQEFGLDAVDDALATGPERIVVAGGDGSLGVAAAAAARGRVPLGVVPIGTANDFARKLGLPDEPERAVRVAARGSETRSVDLAWMGDRPFLNVASIGLAPVAAEKASGLKRLLGPLAYALGALRAGLAAQPVECTVVCDGHEAFSGGAWQATVACSGAFGGGAELEADPSDGRLDAIAIEAGSRLALAWRAGGLRRGTIGAQAGVHTCGGTVVELTVPHGTAFNVDGEVVRSGPARFRAQARAVDVVVG
jgi:diacylglycerol kinase (ATP)